MALSIPGWILRIVAKFLLDRKCMVALTTRVARWSLQAALCLRQHGTSPFFCAPRGHPVFALAARKRTTI